ncbi:MAG: hypothetical protein GF383_03225 [Candidatus Lokiarchaeota archaeon]|nr:hypothetical protein [Candidatus Lokiarchaeota archaeon]
MIFNQDLIGYVQNDYYVIPNIIPTVFLIFAMIMSVIFALIFAKTPLKSSDPKIRWKAKFLILAFISLIIGATVELFNPVNIVIFLIARSILLSSGFEYYFAFFLPERFLRKT